MESTLNQMMWLGESVLTHGRLVDPDQLRARLQAVEAEDVRAAARSILGKGLRAVVAVGPVELTEEAILRHCADA